MRKKSAFLLIGFITLIVISLPLIKSQLVIASPVPAANSMVNIDLSYADTDDYVDIRVQGCIKGGGSTNGWWYFNETHFDSNGEIDLDLGYQFSSLDVVITVYIDGYPDCPWHDSDSDGECLGSNTVSIDFDLDAIYPWSCPE